MAVAASGPRVDVDGKFFRLGNKKFHVKGVSYGPFEPNSAGQCFASAEQTAADFGRIRELGANLMRIYDIPAKWFLDLALQHELRVLVDIPWNNRVRFLDSAADRANARDAVRRAVFSCARHPALFALSVANEIPPDVVRWSGPKAVASFIDALVGEVKSLDADCLCTFSSFPSTEFLRPQAIDFVCFNVYLHQRPAFKNYLARLQMQADSKPLLLGETGIDSLREGEERKSAILSWQIEESFRSGLAGTVVFSFTDDWWRGGKKIEDWSMGLTTRDRQPKPSFFAVQKTFQAAPYFPLRRHPKVSVVVASYNGERTLRACLDSLLRLNYPDYEVILVDDGSTDTTRTLAATYQCICYLRHETNLGLSAARNTGIGAASGEIIAFTDSDCRADEDWLYYLVGGLIDGDFAGIGGPNLLPPEDSPVAAAVMVSPGGPAHVMLTDRQAEHIPGCNMAFYKSALLEIDGFDPIFHQAGDDVDLCWRLQQAGFKIGFSAAAFVWHYRRSTIRQYLHQQKGYGEAEAMLVRKHPEYFNPFGGSVWRGRIYTTSKFGVLIRPPVIYHGFFASAGFQFLYSAEPSVSLMLCTTLEYHVLVTLPLWILSVNFHYLLPLAVASLLMSLGVCAAAGLQAALPGNKTRPWSRVVVAMLFFLQPIARGLARYQGRLSGPQTPLAVQQSLDSVALRHSRRSLESVCYWAEQGVDRLAWIAAVLGGLEKQGWPYRPDIGWSDYDAEIYGSRWTSLQLVTVVEEHAGNKKMLCCRLRANWSLQARVIFWGLCGFELLVLGLLGSSLKWLWFVLLSLPLLAWSLQHTKRSLQSVIIVFLDELAKRWNLVKVGSEEPTVPAKAAMEPPDPKSPFRQASVETES
jgi:glycosyltransferase involved in cell wall biosynthesis